MNMTRVVMGVALLCVGLLKVIGEPQSHLFPTWIVTSSAIAEIVAGVAILRGRSFVGYVFVILLSLAGLGVALIVGDPRGCGCLGAWMTLNRWQHAMLSASFGITASVLLNDLLQADHA